ncbi:MAG TPA: cyclic nucleotide-binding domain-containing protein [Alphaproteobacteria bacterium]|nr:cyclic nucleotide-binding domain-containing protein [Alphaproteobacteria bacterium]
MRQADLQTLQQSSLFHDIAPRVVAGIAADGLVQALPKGTFLFAEGDQPEFCHMILGGRAGLIAQDGADRETTIEFFGPGDMLVGAAVILDMPYLVSARLAADSRMLLIPAESFRRHVRHEPALANACLRQLASHWRLLIGQIKDLKLKTAPQRVGGYLLEKAGDVGGRAVVTLGEQRKVLAGRLGMSPESLSRALAELRSFGVGCHGRDVVISDVKQLREYCKQSKVPRANA